MALAHTARAVVFALDDLPAEDRQHIQAVAQYMNLPQDAASWRTPLVLTREEAGPLAPGLSSDVEIAGSGPSLLLLAMRLLLADAWSWPEQRFIADDASSSSRVGYTLLAADPSRWTADSLARELLEQAHVEVRRGLQPRGARAWMPGDRVPVLGWEVPVLGRRDPVAALRDARPAEERPHRFAGVALPLGTVPGHQTDRHGLFFRVLEATCDGERGDALVEVLRADGASGALECERLRLRLGDLGPTWECGADADALAELLRDLLPGSLYCCPQGGLLLLDLHRVELSIAGREGGALGPIRAAALPPRKWLPEDAGAAPLDPGLWEPGALAALLHPEECRLSPRGRLAALRFAGVRDGEPVDAWLVLDTAAPGGARALAWQAELSGPAMALALGEDERLMALHGAEALSPACLADERAESEEGAAEWLARHAAEVLVLSAQDSGGPAVVTSLPLPLPLRGAASPSLAFAPGGALLCYQAATRTLAVIDLQLSGGPRLRPARSSDLAQLLGCDGGAALARLLRTLSSGGAIGDEPRLGWLAPLLGTVPPGAAAELQALPAADAARALTQRLIAAGLRSCDGDEPRPIG